MIGVIKGKWGGLEGGSCVHRARGSARAEPQLRHRVRGGAAKNVHTKLYSVGLVLGGPERTARENNIPCVRCNLHH